MRTRKMYTIAQFRAIQQKKLLIDNLKAVLLSLEKDTEEISPLEILSRRELGDAIKCLLPHTSSGLERLLEKGRDYSNS